MGIEDEQDWAREEHLPALLALYDSLNDDDDDVRDVGSAAVKSILGQALVPIEAANRLLSWLSQRFGHDSTFRQVVVRRIMGDTRFPSPESHTASVSDELQNAMKFDDSLFVIEEQNLFVDEVREAQRWVSIYDSLSWEAKDPALEVLAEWSGDGIDELRRLVGEEDGPLGYGSKPEVFAILSRVVYASISLAKERRHPHGRLLESLDKFNSERREGQGHMSGLLLQPLEKTIDI